MPFAYSCFVSYRHGEHELMTTFMRELKASLQSSLEPYFRLPVYVDDRLKSGYRYNEALAQALCQSLVMVVVFTPQWAESDYCQREFQGMLELEQRRRRLAKGAIPRELGLIVPVLLRGRREELPEDIREHIHFCDFSRYTTADSRIGKNRAYVEKVEEIARYIYDVHRAIAPFDRPASEKCAHFKLPAAVAGSGIRRQPFPGRAA